MDSTADIADLKRQIARQLKTQSRVIGLLENEIQARNDALAAAEKTKLERLAVDRVGKIMAGPYQRCDDALRDSFNVLAPQPRAGEEPEDFERRLYKFAHKYLSPASPLANVRADDLTSETLPIFMPRMIEEIYKAKRDPLTVDDSTGYREVLNYNKDTQQLASREFIGNRCFVADYARKGKMVRIREPYEFGRGY
jgi:hypothetical protein